MANDDAEKRKIARLDFTISDAINSLDIVEKKLKSISEQSEKYAKDISKNINSGITINVSGKEVETNLKEIENVSKKTQEQMLKNAQKSQLKQTEIVLQEEEKRKTASYKAVLNQQKYNDMVEKSAKSMYDKITGYAKTYLIYQGFNQLKHAISETIDEMVDLEYQMVAIDRVLNEDSLNIDRYRNNLIQLAYDYGNSFSNVADITLRLAQAGFDSQEALALTEKTLLALNTAELNATQATDDMVAVMAQWGLMTGTATEQAKSYGDIIDKINKVADNFPTTSEDIMNALKKVSSAFNLAGASIDETIATIVAAEKASQRGGKVIGTALSNITQQLKAEGKLNLAEQLGLNFYTDDAKTTFKPIMEIFQEMASRMEQLKNEGKESTVEMQNLLELFTVFRRNVGASLLGEMSGEDNTYLQALEMSINSVGYSLQENEKYMRTAKAAQAQFNAELLKLKTQVWDNGLEDVFRNILSMGTDIIKGISNIIDKFGVIPTTIGAVTAAYTVLSNKIKIQNIGKLTTQIKAVNAAIQASEKGLKVEDEVLKGTSKTFQNYAVSVEKGKASLIGYAGNVVKTTAQTALLTAGTIALNAALSFGLSFAITAITSAIDNWVHAEEKAIEKAKELRDTANENASQLQNEVKTYQDLQTELEETVKQYNELKNAKKDTGDTEKKLYELQAQINSQMKETGKQVNIIKQDITEQGEKVQVVNDKYEEQLDLIKSIAYEKKKQQVEELKTAMEQAQQGVVGIKTKGSSVGWTDSYTLQLSRAGIDRSFGGENKPYSSGEGNWVQKDYFEFLNTLSPEKQLKTLKEWNQQLEEAAYKGENVGDVSKYVKEKLNELQNQYDEVSDSTQKYVDALGELYEMSGQLDNFNTFLDSISRSYNLEGPKELIEQLKEINQQFSDGTINIEEYFNKIEEKIQEIDLEAEGEELEAYQAIFAATSATLADGIQSLMSGVTSGAIDFTEYAEGIKEIADNTIDLVFKAEDANNEYLDTLASARDELAQYSSVLDTIGESYDFIAQHANSAGEAMFKQADETTEAYQLLATNLTNTLNNLRDNSEMAFRTITNSISQNIQDSTNDMFTAEGYLSEGFLNNYANMNTALNAIKADAEQATNQTTQALGNVFKTLGDVIEKFDYKITGTPTISGSFGLETNEMGIPTGLRLPTFGFNITGEAGSSVSGLASALRTYGEGINTSSKINFAYNALANNMRNTGGYTAPSRASSGGGSTASKSGGGSSGSSYTRDNSQKEAEDLYKIQLQSFKDFFEERERLEKRWVTKQKDLGQLETNDFLFITEQRIKRYQQYLDTIKKATWLNTEDRLALEKKYSEALEDLQVDYIEYLGDKLKEEIEAIKNNNKEKIQTIKDEAEARINALKKVESETDRIREKEEYERKRQEHLDDISYWEQRTGREAQERLKEARANLEELDREWDEKQQDWNIEDQIKAIEEERDAQVKAIEDAQQAEIDAMQAVYDEKVKLFAETGQIIYENSVMQSQNLYKAYKENFIDPVTSDLYELNRSLATNVAESSAKSNKGASENKATEPEQQYVTYKIRSGDTLTKIARQYGTSIEKILEANPYVTNKNRIYTGKTLQIPKFHEGGIVGGNQEAFALLKPNEVILKPEWADGINKLAKMARQKENNITNNSTVIEVKGDLVRLEANVKDKTDAEYLTKRIEKVLKDKFNIKK